MKNDWRENYVRSIKEVNDVLKNQMISSEQIIQSPRFSTKIEISQINGEKSGSPMNKTFRRRRVVTATDKTIDLSNLTILENLHKRMTSMLRLKKALNFTTDKQQCEQNSRFLNSFLEDSHKKFCIVSTQNPGNKRIIGVLRNMTERRKSVFVKKKYVEKENKRAKSLSVNRAKSLSINNISYSQILKENEPDKQTVEFKNGRKLKQHLYKAIKLKV